MLTNNRFSGCVSVGLGNMSKTLNEIILMNNGFRSCISSEIRLLRKLTVLDFSFNGLMRPIPDAIGGMKKLKQLNVAKNEDEEEGAIRRWRRISLASLVLEPNDASVTYLKFKKNKKSNWS